MQELFSSAEICLLRELSTSGSPKLAVYFNRMTREEICALVIKLTTLAQGVSKTWEDYNFSAPTVNP